MFASCCQDWAHRECDAGREGLVRGTGSVKGMGLVAPWVASHLNRPQGALHYDFWVVWRVRVFFMLVRAADGR